MSVDEKFMKLAIKEAQRSRQRLKCGAVIVKDGAVISKASNYQRVYVDATAHAEIKAIREAGKKVGDKNLNKCVIYCTCEPCVMCLGAIVFSKIEKLVYGVSLKDISDKKSLIDIDTDSFLAKSPRKFQVVKNFMESECREVI